jgi:hypothetical protein
VLYPQLPSPFAGFALWASDARYFVDPIKARDMLIEAGIPVAPEIGRGVMDSAWLEPQQSLWGPEMAEGVVLAWGDGQRTVARAKRVHPGYTQNHRWSDIALVRQGR